MCAVRATQNSGWLLLVDFGQCGHGGRSFRRLIRSAGEFMQRCRLGCSCLVERGLKLESQATLLRARARGAERFVNSAQCECRSINKHTRRSRASDGPAGGRAGGDEEASLITFYYFSELGLEASIKWNLRFAMNLRDCFSILQQSDLLVRVLLVA